MEDNQLLPVSLMSPSAAVSAVEPSLWWVGVGVIGVSKKVEIRKAMCDDAIWKTFNQGHCKLVKYQE